MSNNYDWSTIDPRIRTAIMSGLALGMLLACLDSTIVSTSIAAILEDLQGMGLYSWVFTAYMLCETIMIPIAGKLSDDYGRRPVFLAGLVLFIGGSFVASLSVDMTMFIVCRAVQGLGGGVLMPVAMATVADLYAPAKRGRIQGMLGALFAVATCLGPFLGGYITDNFTWHWVFYINIPFGLLSLVLVLRKFPKQAEAPEHHIDYLGMALLAAALVDLLLFFTWAGSDIAWVSVESGAMLVVLAVLLIAFAWQEKRAQDPVLAPRLFRQRTFICCSVILLVFGLGMMGVMAYLPIFMQMVVGMTASNTGEILIPLVIGMMITSVLSGMLVARTGYRIWMMVGAVISAIGMYLLSTLGTESGETLAVAYLFVTGVGMGCVMSVVMVAAQNSAKRDEVGMVTSGVSLFRSIGGTVAVGVFTTLINGRMATELASALPASVYDAYPHSIAILDYIYSDLFPYAHQIIVAYGHSINFAFFVAAIIVLLVFVVALFLKDNKPHDLIDDTVKRLQEHADAPAAPVGETDQPAAEEPADGAAKEDSCSKR